MLNATLTGRDDITEGLFLFRVKPDAGVPDFQPGQYVALGLPPELPRMQGCPPDPSPQKPGRVLKRAYSIGSAPHEKEALEFYIALVPEGLLTPRLAVLREGDRLFVAPKIVGTFTCEPVPENCSLVLVSTGTGIAPFISMLRSAETWTPGRKITIVHGVRYVSDLAYKEELLHLERERGESFRYFSTVSRAGEDWEGRRGYVQELFRDGTIQLDPARDHVFVCGNPAMIEEVEGMLTDQGYTEHTRRNPGNLHVEKYW